MAITKGSESTNVAAQLTVSGDPLTATMNPASDSVEVGGRAVFAINISGSTGIASWTCSSSDTGVATARMVAEGCEATGVAEGSATVTAIVQKGGETVDAVAQLTVFRVVEPPVYTVELHEAVYLIGCDNYKITAFAAHYTELGAAGGPWGSWGGNGLWTSAHGAISMRNACLRGGSAWKIGPDGRTAEEPSYELYTRPFTIVSSLLQEPHLVVDPHLDYRFPPDYDPNYDKDTYEPTGDEGPDVALVRIAGDVQVNPRLRLLPKDAHIAVGDRVRAAGFSENKPTATFADAIINDIKRVGMNGVGDTEHTWLTAGLGMRPGASGSPVIDDDGYVVGILVTARRNVANKDNDIVHADELWDLGCRSSGECNGGSAH